MTPRRALALLAAVSFTVAAVLAATGATAAPNDHELTGAGDSWPEMTVRQLQNDAAAAGQLGGLDPAYTAARGEVPAKDDLVNGDLDFAAAQDLLTADEVATAREKHEDIAYVPYAGGAVGIVLGLQVDQQHGGGLITNLQLTIPTLAKLFTHRIQYWNDPEVLAENPDIPNLKHLEVNQVIAVVRRDSSATTSALIRTFLADPDAKPIWNTYAQGNGAAGDTALDAWPQDPVNNTIGTVSGSRGVIDAVLNLDPTTGTPVPGTPAHAVGYVAPAFADQFHAPLVALQNHASPATFVAPMADAVSAAIEAATSRDAATGAATIDYAKMTKTGAYPIPLISSFIVPLHALPSAKATAMAAFIRFVLSPAGTHDIATTGMVPLPAFADFDRGVATTLETNATSSTTTTPATSTSASPTTPTTASTPSTSTTPPSVVAAAASASPSSSTFSTADLGATGASGGAAAADPSSSSSGSTLPFTGSRSLPFLVGGFTLTGASQLARRRVRR